MVVSVTVFEAGSGVSAGSEVWQAVRRRAAKKQTEKCIIELDGVKTPSHLIIKPKVHNFELIGTEGDKVSDFFSLKCLVYFMFFTKGGHLLG